MTLLFATTAGLGSGNVMFHDLLFCRPGRKLVYDTRARRVAQFARGSAGPGPPDRLFKTLPRGGSLSSREAVLAPRRPPHYLRHFREAGQAGTRPAGHDPEPARGRRHRKRDPKYYTNRAGPGRNPSRRPGPGAGPRPPAQEKRAKVLDKQSRSKPEPAPPAGRALAECE